MGNWDVSKQDNDGEPCGDAISRSSIKQKLQEHHDFYVKAYGGFSNLPQNDKSRVDEINACIAMVVNEPPVTPKQEPCEDTVSLEVFEQVMWERDVAIEQLKELGYGFGEKQRTGHWIECEDEVKCFCSECKEISDYPTKFCPNCGAKMEEMKE